jgi:hypothetical protein
MIGPTNTPIPKQLIVDAVSGYAVNVPVTEQDYPGWWNDRPEVYARIKQARKDLGIDVIDFPNGVSQPTDKIEMLPMREPPHA